MPTPGVSIDSGSPPADSIAWLSKLKAHFRLRHMGGNHTIAKQWLRRDFLLNELEVWRTRLVLERSPTLTGLTAHGPSLIQRASSITGGEPFTPEGHLSADPSCQSIRFEARRFCVAAAPGGTVPASITQ